MTGSAYRGWHDGQGENVSGISNRVCIGWDEKPPRRFEIAIRQAEIDDLRQRLTQTRWPDEVPDGTWKFGTDLNYLQNLVRYWQDGYQWREHEAFLNGFNQFKASIDGIGVHFIHEIGEGPAPLPILLTHGWPGSFYEFHIATSSRRL